MKYFLFKKTYLIILGLLILWVSAAFYISHKVVEDQQIYGKLLNSYLNINHLNAMTLFTYLAPLITLIFIAWFLIRLISFQLHGYTSRLEDNEHKFNEVQQIAKVGSWTYILKDDLIISTQQTIDIFGFNSDEKHTFEYFVSFLHNDDKENVKNAFNTALLKNEDYDVVYRIMRHDDKVKYLHARGKATYDKNNELSGAIGTVQDITEEKLANDKIQKAETKFHTIFNESPDGIILINLSDQRFVEFNISAYEMYGYTKEEFANVTVKDLEIIEDKNEIIKRQQNVLKRGWDKFVTKHQTKEGKILDVFVKVKKIELDGTSFLYATFHDLTSDKIIEQNLALALSQYESERLKYKTILDSASDGVHILDVNGNIVEFSQSFCDMLGYTREEMYKLNVKDWDMGDIKKEDIIKIVNDLMSEPKKFYTKHKRKDGTIFDVEINAKGLKLDDTLYLYASARDMTIIKNMEESLRTLNATLETKVQTKTQKLQHSNKMLEGHIADLNILNSKLTEAKEDALQAAQARSNFISGISHELRTPLNAIINFTDQIIEDFDDMLVDQELQIDTQEFLQRVIINSKHLLQLINDLLEFTKAEAGKIDYKIEEHDINEILQMAYNNTYSLLNGTEIKFHLNPYETPLIASVDSRRLLQVMLNLLSNAIKFTQKGQIDLRSYIKDEMIIIEVEDTGKGIPKDKQKTIFDPFTQVNSTDNGTGLGLGLVKRMCDDMGIEILLISIEGSGTIFQLMISKTQS